MPYQVLLVDDDDPTRTVYHEILRRMNFEVIEASDGVKALEMLNRYVPTVIILDLLLPRKSGREVLDYIYATPRFANTRVIIFSAHEGLLPLKLRPGDEFLLKPLNPQLLRDAVTRAVTSSPHKH
ncbi:MAG TPA: response regulator [Phototrophicaceae bacterium]|nr:response regulator [Phototrophicaceae bacterium]